MNIHVKTYTTGLILILVSWALKHLLVSAAIFGGGQGLESDSIRAQIDAEVWSETYEDQLELAELRLEADDSKSPDKIYEKISKLEKDILEAQVDIEEEFLEAKVNARYAAVKGESKGLSLVKWAMKLKVLLDLFKIGGVFMIVLASMRIIRCESDPKDAAEGSTRALAITTIGLVLFGTFVQGVISFFG